MGRITLKQFIGDADVWAIHCKYEMQANKLLKALNSFGRTPDGNGCYLEDSKWQKYRDRTCYDNKGGFDDIENLKGMDPLIAPKIFNYEDLRIDSRLEVTLEDLLPFTGKVGVIVFKNRMESKKGLIIPLRRYYTLGTVDKLELQPLDGDDREEYYLRNIWYIKT